MPTKNIQIISGSMGKDVVRHSSKTLDNTISYIKDVPEKSASYAVVNTVGGMTRKCSNLWNPEKTTFSGIKTTKNADGSVTVETNNVSMGATIVLTQKLPSGQYTFTNLDGTTIYIMRSGSDYTTGVTIGSSKTFEYDGESFLRLMASDQQANTIRTYKWMLNSGEKALPYEPYFEGLRSAPVTEVESVGANLIPFPYTESSKEKNGISYTVNADGSVRAKGTATLTDNFILRGDGSLLDLGVKDGETVSVSGEFGFAVYDVTENKGYTNTSFVVNANHVYRIRINFAKGSTIDTTFYPMLNKGSTALPYTPYQRNTLAIPDEVKALDGYGWGINESVFNYIDWEKKQFVKRVGCVDMGALEWYYSSDYMRFRSSKLNNIVNKSYSNNFTICSFDYNVDVFSDSGRTNGYCVFDYGILVRDSAYTDAATFKAAMSGVMLYYELATPEITDISDLLPDGSIKVQENGTVTFKNEYNYDIPNEVTFYTSDSSNETIAVKSVIGDLVGTASKAIADGDGNIITNTYAKITDAPKAAGTSLGLVKSGGDVTISDGVITVNDDSHNHIISNVDGLQTALNEKSDAIDWDCPTQVNAYSRICAIEKYGTGLLTLRFDQNSQAVVHTYLVGTAYSMGSLSQIGSDGYSANFQQTIRLVQINATKFVVEVLNTYGYNGATSVTAHCTYIPLTKNQTFTPYTTYTATSTSATVVATLESKYDGIVAKKFYGDLSGNASSATKATQDGNGNVITSTYATKSVATTSTNGLMSSADKKKIDAVASYYQLGNMSGKTIADLQTALDTWLDSYCNIPNATANFSADKDWVTAWNSSDTTKTISAGGQWQVAIIARYSTKAYTQLRISYYSDEQVYYVVRSNSTWSPAHQAAFKDDLTDLETNIQTKLDKKLDKSGGTMTGDLNMVNQKIVFDDSESDHTLLQVGEGSWGYRVDYKGTGSGNNNTLVVVADNQQGTGVNAVTMYQDGTTTFAKTITASGGITGNLTGNATSATKATQDGNGNNIVNTYATKSAASQSAAGLMSAADKTKLDGIATGANKTTVDSSLSSTSTNPVQNKVINTALASKADLVDGKVPSSQLPSYVDDVLEYSAKSSFPTTGESGKIYVDIATNKTYRWSGSAYVEISASLAIGTTASTAAAGNHTHSSYVNQNAFSNIKVGDTTIAADTTTDTFTLVAGNNITLTPDATNDKITISATNTTYTLGSFGITATATELNYVDGVTSNIQTQLNDKATVTIKTWTAADMV